MRLLDCFVIGPIGDANGPAGSAELATYDSALEVLNTVILPACRAIPEIAQPSRADRIAKPGEIPEQVFRAIRDYPVVVADLTDANPNVMYELGLRHTRNLLTIQIGEVKRLPFDVAAIRTIMFTRSPEGLQQARVLLEASLREGVSGSFDPVTATRLWLEIWRDQLHPPAFQPPGTLEKVPEMVGAVNQLTKAWLPRMLAVTKAVAEIAAELRRRKEELDAAEADASKYEPMKRVIAMRLEDAANETETLVAELQRFVSALVYGIDHLVLKFRKNPNDPEIADVTGLPEFLDDLVAGSRNAAAHSDPLAGLTNLSRLFVGPADRIGFALRSLPAIVGPLVGRSVDLRYSIKG